MNLDKSPSGNPSEPTPTVPSVPGPAQPTPTVPSVPSVPPSAQPSSTPPQSAQPSYPPPSADAPAPPDPRTPPPHQAPPFPSAPTVAAMPSSPSTPPSPSGPPAQGFGPPPGGATPAYGYPPAAPVAGDPWAAGYAPAPVPAAGHPGLHAPVVPTEYRVGAGPRFVAYLINIGLAIVTLGIGWLVWTLVTWSTDSANPGQKMMGLTIVRRDTGARLTWGQMFVRNFLLATLTMGVLNGLTCYIVGLVDMFKVFGVERQTLVDTMAGTVVVRAHT